MELLKSMEHYEQLKQEDRILFMFSASWCPDCTVIEPILPGIEADYPEYTFIHVDRDKFIDLCGELDIFGIPSFIAFHDGEEAGRFVSKNRKSREEIKGFIDSL